MLLPAMFGTLSAFLGFYLGSFLRNFLSPQNFYKIIWFLFLITGIRLAITAISKFWLFKVFWLNSKTQKTVDKNLQQTPRRGLGMFLMIICCITISIGPLLFRNMESADIWQINIYRSVSVSYTHLTLPTKRKV